MRLRSAGISRVEPEFAKRVRMWVHAVTGSCDGGCVPKLTLAFKSDVPSLLFSPVTILGAPVYLAERTDDVGVTDCCCRVEGC
jgi:hypothetical protein